MVDLYRKLSFPLVSFIMAIYRNSVLVQKGRKGAFYGVGLRVVVGIFYWSTFELFDKLGGINRLSPLMAAWFLTCKETDHRVCEFPSNGRSTTLESR